MEGMMRRFIGHPALAIGSTLLWGLIEWMALLRSRRDASRILRN